MSCLSSPRSDFTPQVLYFWIIVYLHPSLEGAQSALHIEKKQS